MYNLGFAEFSLPGLIVFLFAIYAGLRFLFPGLSGMFRKTAPDEGELDLD
jgi:hypothetical protein